MASDEKHVNFASFSDQQFGKSPETKISQSYKFEIDYSLLSNINRSVSQKQARGRQTSQKTANFYLKKHTILIYIIICLFIKKKFKLYDQILQQYMNLNLQKPKNYLDGTDFDTIVQRSLQIKSDKPSIIKIQSKNSSLIDVSQLDYDELEQIHEMKHKCNQHSYDFLIETGNFLGKLNQ